MDPRTSENSLKAGTPRRQSLIGTGLVVGAFGIGRSLTHARAQSVDDEPEDCSPVPPPPAQAIPFKPDTNAPTRIRKSTFALDDGEIKKLKAAFAALRALPNDDPRTWIRQANVHC